MPQSSRREFLRVAGLGAGAAALVSTTGCARFGLPPTARVSLETTAREVVLTARDTLQCRFVCDEGGRWRIAGLRPWNRTAGAWDEEGFGSTRGEFLYLGREPDFAQARPGACAYGEAWEPIEEEDGRTGVCFRGTSGFGGGELTWAVSYTFDRRDLLPLLHTDATYRVDRDVSPGHAPKLVTRTMGGGPSPHRPSLAHIMGYEAGDNPLLIERGYPLIWLRLETGGGARNALLINDVEQDSPAGRYFVFNRSARAPHFSYWFIGSMRKWGVAEEIGRYYWMYRDPVTGGYPEETELLATREYRIRSAVLFDRDLTMKQAYDRYWARAFDTVCPLEQVPFWATDWDGCARGQVREFRDDDQHAGDRYVPGCGYFAAPRQCTMSHGAGNVCWHGTVSIVHAMLYYTRVTGDRESFRFYADRLADADLPRWAENSSRNKGWINEFWIEGQGWPAWSSMYLTLDIGAHGLYHCYRLTGDRTYWYLLRRLVDYTRDVLVTGRGTLGEHWVDSDEQWYRFTPESGFTQAQAVPKGEDPGDYPGALAMYADLCLLVHSETGERSYRENALAAIDHVNTFLSKPQRFWTLVQTPKPNGFAFACLVNVKRYELTGDPRWLDAAEEWLYLLLTLYHLRSESGNEVGLAHAGGLGLQDYVCVAALETVEPICTVTRLLRHRVNPVLLRYLALADRRHLIVYPATHPDREFVYPYIPMELIPQRDSFAMYMAGPILILNTMLHALHQSTDPEVLAVCLEAADSEPDVRHRRTVIVYNPTSTRRRFHLRFRGLDPGPYTLDRGRGRPLAADAGSLESDGIPLALDPQEWMRLGVSRA